MRRWPIRRLRAAAILGTGTRPGRALRSGSGVDTAALTRVARSLLLLIPSLPVVLNAQDMTPGTSTDTQLVATITAAALASHAAALQHDSVRIRTIPSPELQRAAQYVATNLQAAGLKPAVGLRLPSMFGQSVADSGSWFQSYPLPGLSLRVNDSATLLLSQTALQRQGHAIVDESGNLIYVKTALNFRTAARFLSDTIPQTGAIGEWGVRKPVMLVAGRQTVATVRQAALRDQVAFYIPAADANPAVQQQIIAELHDANHVVVLREAAEVRTGGASPGAGSGGGGADGARAPVWVADAYMERALGINSWDVAVAAESLQTILQAAGVEVAALRTAGAPILRRLPNTSIMLEPHFTAQSDSVPAGLNVVGFLEGSDSILRREFVVIFTHLDGGAQSGLQAGSPAVGVSTLLTLARAFGAPRARPRRSMLFVALSGVGPGTGAGFWGSNFFVGNSDPDDVWPVALPRMVVALNIDGMGPAAGDSLVISGLRDLELATTPVWIAAQHPELGLTVVDGGTIAVPETGYYPFVQRLVPTLRLASGGAAAASTPAVERQARLVRLAFYVSRTLANSTSRPGWSAQGRTNIFRTRP